MQPPSWNLELIPFIEHEASKHQGRSSVGFSLTKISNALEGLEKGELVAIVAPPGEGKTQLGRTIALDFIAKGMNVVYCTYELTMAQMLNMFTLAGLESCDTKHLLLAPKEHLVKDILFIEKLMEENRKNMVDCLIIDDIHALEERYGFNQPDNTALFLRALAGRLKTLAIKSNCIVITMAHLRKDAIRGKENSLSDIAYSGGLGQVADTILAIRQEAQDLATIEITKSRWAGKKIKVKVKSIDKRFVELQDYEYPPTEIVNKFRSNSL